MACFHPNHVVVRDGQSLFLGSGAWLKSDDLYYNDDRNFHALVPCGRCMGCRLDKARVWADRMLLELRDNDYKAIFVTLTYDNLHLPPAGRDLGAGFHYLADQDDYDYLFDDELWVLSASGAPSSLSVRDTQLFLKRLRKQFRGRRLRYFLCGEYGPRTKRPHYHAIIYGLSLADFPDCRIHDFNNLGQPRYKSKSFQRIWNNGFCVLAPVNWNTCAYVSRYTTKKFYKSDSPGEYDYHRLQPFCTMSRRPGIGLLHAADLLSKGDKAFVRNVDLNGKDCVREIYLGRPFIRSAIRTPLHFDSIVSLYKRQKKRACDSVQRTKSNLAVFGGCVLKFYQDKEVHLLERFRLLPERGDLFGQASSSQSQTGQKNIYPYRC